MYDIPTVVPIHLGLFNAQVFVSFHPHFNDPASTSSAAGGHLSTESIGHCSPGGNDFEKVRYVTYV